jgi:hypothetical protein
MDLFVTLRIIVKICCNNKTNLLCCFVDFRKAFDTMPRINLCNKLEELKVHFKLRAIEIRLYENVTPNFRNTEGWSNDINYNIGVKQGRPSSLILFVIYIDKLKGCLEEVGCVSTSLVGIVIILLHVDGIYSYDVASL